MTATQLETRIQELLDGTLDDKHLPALKKHLLESEEARKTYCTYARMHSLLRQRALGLKSLDSLIQPIPIDEIIEEKKQHTLRYAALATAAVLLLSFLALYTQPASQAPSSLTFETSPNSVFTLSHEENSEAPVGNALNPGSRITLRQGFAKLTFRSGVHSVVRAPAELHLVNDSTLQLQEGTCWFDVPANAVGFTVTTKDLEVVDLGTQFGVKHIEGQPSEVHVFKGSVRVTSQHNTSESHVLTQHEGRTLASNGHLLPLEVAPTAFTDTLPESLPYLHWDFAHHQDGFQPIHNSISHKEINTSISDATSFQRTSREGHIPDALMGSNESAITANWTGIANDNPRSIAFWLKKPTQENYLEHIVGWGEYSFNYNGNAFYSFIKNRNGEHEVGLSINGVWVKAPLPDSDEWHHIAFTYDGTSYPDGFPVILAYINGEEVSTSTHKGDTHDPGVYPKLNTITNSPKSSPLTLFGNPHNYSNNKNALFSIDELYIFEGCISPKSIKKLSSNAVKH